MKTESTFKVKKGLAEMLKGGVIMDVVNAEQAKIAEKSGAVAVMALERIPADIRAEGGVSRMSSVEVIQEVMDTVSIPVMAKARIGHFVEAQMLEELGVDFTDDILDTPPSALMSAGILSSAITATAPDFSAIFACSALTTSIMTPPFSISAKPFFTLNVDSVFIM